MYANIFGSVDPMEGWLRDAKGFDFIVIGAGIAGASVAAELAANHSVCLLEAEAQPGYHSTGRSAALFSEVYGNRLVRGLSRASRRQMFEPSSTFASQPWTTPRGAVFIANREQTGDLQSLAGQRDIHPFVHELNAADTRALCPVIRSDYVAGLYEPGASDIDVHGLHQAYLRQLRGLGGRLVTSRRVDAISRVAGDWVIEAGEEKFVSPILINAAGAWADQVAILASVAPVGLRALRRTAILVDAPEGHSIRAWPLVIAADETFYFKPEAGKLLLSPADETHVDPGDVQADEWDVAVAVDRVTAAVDIEVHRVRHRWAGLRTFAPDRSPVVGYDQAAAGFFWLAGQGGYGVQTAPALAIVAAALARGQPIPQAIADFGVDAADLSPRRLET
jgi:D-arginine dehydrogenase